MTVTNYYEILKIDSKSDLNTIKKAFRKEIAIYHPDNNSSLEGTEKFDIAVEAFDVLSDKEKRQVFDNMLKSSLNNKLQLVDIVDQDNYQNWQKESKVKSKKYKSKSKEDLLLLDLFLDIGSSGILFGIDETVKNVGDSFNEIGDALDGVFDLF